MLSPVTWNHPNWLLGGALETSLQLGLGLGLASLAGAPFASGRAKLIAGTVGGALPMFVKNFVMEFAPERDRAKLLPELILTNVVELGLTVALAFLPSRRLMFVVNPLTSSVVEYLRQRRIWDRTRDEALQSAAIAGGGTLVIGLLLSGIPLLKRRPFQTLWQDRGRWGRVEAKLEDWYGLEGIEYGQQLRRGIGEPTAVWYRGEERAAFREMQEVVRRLRFHLREIHGSDVKTPDQGFYRRCDILLEELTRADQRLNRSMSTYQVFQGEDRAALPLERHFDAFLHEFRHDDGLLRGALTVLRGSPRIDPQMVAIVEESTLALENLLQFYSRRPGLIKGLELIRERFSRRGARVVLDVTYQTPLSREADFDLLIILRERVRNAVNAAERRQREGVRIVIEERAGAFAVVDNAGGIDPAEVAMRVGGQGHQITGSHAESRGWRIIERPIEGGTEVVVELTTQQRRRHRS